MKLPKFITIRQSFLKKSYLTDKQKKIKNSILCSNANNIISNFNLIRKYQYESIYYSLIYLIFLY